MWRGFTDYVMMCLLIEGNGGTPENMIVKGGIRYAMVKYTRLELDEWLNGQWSSMYCEVMRKEGE